MTISDLSGLEVGERDLVLADVGLQLVPQLGVGGEAAAEVAALHHPDLLCGELVLPGQPLVVAVHHVAVGGHHVPQHQDPLVHLHVQLPAGVRHGGAQPGHLHIQIPRVVIMMSGCLATSLATA